MHEQDLEERNSAPKTQRLIDATCYLSPHGMPQIGSSEEPVAVGGCEEKTSDKTIKKTHLKKKKEETEKRKKKRKK